MQFSEMHRAGSVPKFLNSGVSKWRDLSSI